MTPVRSAATASASAARRPWRALGLIWLAALLLDLWGIQHGPLRDWDESLVARVALEFSDRSWSQWLQPTLWGEPYLNKPPAAHWLIGGLIGLWRASTAATGLPPEWLIRLGPALGSSLLSPLLGLVQWQLRPGKRAAAIWTAAISLTLLPLVRHAHLAMLDGLQLSAMATVWLGLLLAQPSRRSCFSAGVLAGLGGALLLLLKAPVAVPVLLAALALRWADRQLPRRSWLLLLAGLGLGLLPGLAWHGWHFSAQGEDALVMWGRQGFARVTNSLEHHAGGPLPPLIQVLSGGWPWLPLWPIAIRQAWQQRRSSWGRWCLGLTALVSLMVLPLQTQLPWYSLLLWPPFALCCGPVLASLINEPQRRPLWREGIARLWLGLGLLLLLAALVSAVTPALAPLQPAAGLALPAGLGLVLVGDQLNRSGPVQRRRRAAWGLVLGWCLSLLALGSSPLWNWELNENASIVPLQPLVAAAGSPADQAATPLIVEGTIGRRPSLRWYAQQPLGKRRHSQDLSQAPQVWLVSQAPTPEQTRLAQRLGRDRIHASSCQLERSGDQGWKRWLCRLRP